jgi:hypothetical protein
MFRTDTSVSNKSKKKGKETGDISTGGRVRIPPSSLFPHPDQEQLTYVKKGERSTRVFKVLNYTPVGVALTISSNS